MEITFLGTGTSQGVPIIGCDCAVCTSSNPKDNRLRSSVMINAEGYQIVIDTGPDFRYQMLREKVKKIDAVVFTHSHKDHIAGLDDIRAFNYFLKRPIDVFATEDTEYALRREFAYIFENSNYPGVPQININRINANESFKIGPVEIQPIKVLHYKMEVLGFRVGDFTYITDANYISEEEIEKIKGTKTLVLNALRHEIHVSHFTLNEAIEIANKIGAEQTYFTHISHQLGLHDEVDQIIPSNMRLSFDGLKINI